MAEKLIVKSITNDNRAIAQFSDKYLPKNARPGEIYVVDGILYVYAQLDGKSETDCRWFPLTDEKEIHTYDQIDDAFIWTIPITFHTDNLQVIVYDNNHKIYKGKFKVDVYSGNIILTFDKAVSGQVYLVVNKSFNWLDKQLVVADKNFAVFPDDSSEYFLEIKTKYVNILKNGNSSFNGDLSVGGSLTVQGDTHFSGNQAFVGDASIDGSLDMTGDLKIGGKITIFNDLLTEMNAYFKKDITVDGSVVIGGDLVVTGTTTAIQTEEIKLDDNIITLNSNAFGQPIQNAGIEVHRGDLGNTTIIQWDEIRDETNIPNNTSVSGKLHVTDSVLIEGNLQVNGSTNIDGNLTIKGENVNIQASTLNITDNIITLNKGTSGEPKNNVGFEIDRGNSGILPLVTFDEISDSVLIPVKQNNGTFNQNEIAGKPFVLTEIEKEKSRAINQETILNFDIESLKNSTNNTIDDLQNSILAETTERVSKDADLQSKITNEINRASSSESAIKNDLKLESSTRVNEILTLRNSIDNEILTRSSSIVGVQTEISAEKVRAENIENTLQTKLNIEIARAKNTEGDLLQLKTTDKNNIVFAINELLTGLNQNEESLSTKITLEGNERKSAITDLQTKIDFEKSVRLTNDNTLSNLISSETTARQIAIANLQTNIDVENSRAVLSEQTLASKLEQYISGTLTTDQLIKSNLTVNENLIIKKNLTVEGVTTTVNSTSSEVSDNKMILNSNVLTGSPVLDGSVVIKRGDFGDQTIIKWYEHGATSEVQVSEWDDLTSKFIHKRVATKPYVDSELTKINSALSTRITTLENDTTNVENVATLTLDVNLLKNNVGDVALLDTNIKTDLVSAINSEIVRVSELTTNLSNSLNAEISRSTLSDNQTKLVFDAEISRAISKDSELESSITNEVLRAKNVEGSVTNLTTVNKTNLTEAINSLKSEVDSNLITQNNTLNSMFTKTGNDIIFKGNLIPQTDSTLTIGSLNKKIGELFVSANTIYLGDNTIISALGLQMSGNLSTTTVNATTITADNIYDKTSIDHLLSDTTTELNLAISTLQTAHNTLVNVVSTDSVSKTVTGLQNIASDLVLQKNLTIQGNLNVLGTKTTTKIVDISIEKNEIILNDGMGINAPYLNAMISVDRGSAGIQPILTWKELGSKSMVLIPYIDDNGQIIQDEVVTSNTLKTTFEFLNTVIKNENNVEKSRALSVETTLNNLIATEINRAMSVEGALENLSSKLENTIGILPFTLVEAINREVSRASGVELSISTTLTSEISKLSTMLEKQSADFDAEVIRAKNKESSIEFMTENEVSRAMLSESNLSDMINTEKTRALSKENEIKSTLTTLTDRTNTLELTLQNNINAEKSRITTEISDRQNAISNLANISSNLEAAFKLADKNLQSNIDNEVISRQTADSTLQNNINVEKLRIDAILAAASADKDSFSEIVTLINSIDTTNDNTFAGYVSTNNTEINSIKSLITETEMAYKLADITLTNNLLNEVTERQNAITSLTNVVSVLDTAYKVADETLTTNLYNEVTERQNAITSLTNIVSALDTAYKSADITLTTNLNAEVTARQNAITSLTNTVSVLDTAYKAADTNLTNAINTEKARIDAILSASAADKDSFAEIVTLINSVDTTNDNTFASYVVSNNAIIADLDTEYKAADTTLTTNLNAEVTARQNAITSLTSTVSTLDAAYKAADTTLTTNLNAEVTARQNAITSLTSTVSALDSAYKTADATLTTNLSNEVTARQNAITSLTSIVSALDTAYKAVDVTLTTNLSNEVSARQTADTNLTNAINTEKARIDAILTASAADKDSFAEIVTLINSVDTTNDNAFASYALTTDAKILKILDGTTPVEKSNYLTTSRMISLSGGASGSVTFDGSKDVDLNITISNNSHSHIIDNITGLQQLLDGKQDTGIFNTVIGLTSTVSNSGTKIISDIVLSSGVVTAINSRTMSLSDFGFTGDLDANKYVHPSTPGNIHIPVGGVAGQVLRNVSPGVAVWSDETNAIRPISDSISLVSSSTTASSTAVKKAYDLANHSHPYASLNGSNLNDFNVKTLNGNVSVKTPIIYDSIDEQYFISPGNNNVSVNVAGAIVAAGDITAFSDIRLKEDIKNIENPMEKVKALNGVTFTRNDLGDKFKRFTGVIAQEVEEVLPEAVMTMADGFKTVSYGNMVGLLIEAIKNQQTQIDELKNEIKNLRGN